MNIPRTSLAALAAGLALSAGCSTHDAVGDTTVAQPSNLTVTPEQRQRIHLVTVQPVSFRPMIEATGSVAFNGDRSTQVLSPVSGPATRVIGTPGMVVHRGDPLAYVSSPDFATAVADYRKAQSGYRNAKRIATRDSALFANDALARAELEQAQTDLVAAEADVDAAVESMRALGVDEAQIQDVKEGKTTSIAAIVRAPIDGTIVEKLIAQGQLLQAGSTACFTIADLGTMWVLANVFANDLPDVAVGQPADVITDIARAPIPGRVDYIASLADPGTKAVQVRILAANNKGVLRRDMFVRVEIKSSAEHRGILVPVSSVLRDEQNLPFVFVAVGKGFGRRLITLGTRVGDQYEAVSGLSPGDQVVTEGSLFLQFAETQ
jgi:cobalt-zinc-cadmium efflux system membrane fusion protein